MDRTKAIDILAPAVGALLLARACPEDSPLAHEILDICRNEILATPPHDDRPDGN